MASIYLIRHGQASFGKADYDQLSEKGINQSRLLGEHWRSLTPPDKYYSGDLLRHGQTHEHFIAGHNGDVKPLIIRAGLNEFNHADILSCYDPQWDSFAKMSESIAKLPEPNKVFQSQFLLALARWTSGTRDQEYKESWPQFKQRCVDALLSVIEQELAIKDAAKSENTFIFTSAGPIAAIIGHILQLSDQNIMLINQQLRNASVTKLLFSKDKLNVDYFNNYNHLALVGADWVTFR